MKSSKKPLDKVEEALIAAYRKQEELQFPPDWQQQVMQDIRGMAGPTAFPEAEPAEKKGWGRIPRRIGALAAAAAVVAMGWLVLANLDWYDPWITLKPDLAALESHGAFWLEAGDVDSGLRKVKVTVIQKEMKVVVMSKDLEPPGGIWGRQDAIKKVDFPLTLDAKDLGLQQGKATIVVTVHDLSWRNGFKGRITTLKKEIVIYRKQSP